jgi:hypothetical protein
VGVEIVVEVIEAGVVVGGEIFFAFDEGGFFWGAFLGIVIKIGNVAEIAGGGFVGLEEAFVI